MQFLIAIILTAASPIALPPSLADYIQDTYGHTSFESVHYSAPTRLTPGSTNSYFMILEGTSTTPYRLTETIECSKTDTSWLCSHKERWRISGRFTVFVDGNSEVQAWISKDHQKALSPYLELLDSIPDQFAQDRYGAPPSIINITTEGTTITYTRYGSGCHTTYGIVSTWSSDRVIMQLDTLDEKVLCI